MTEGVAKMLPREVLEFWFGRADDEAQVLRTHAPLWFRKSAELDAEITMRFGAVVAAASQGGLNEWSDTAQGVLARIILVDQFRRNIHRNSAAAFEADARARAWTLDGIERGLDRQLRPVERTFFYLPLEHAEDRTLQARCVQLFEALRDSVPEPLREAFEGYLAYARAHRDIIERFGRFPHRNALLARPSSPEEIAFLAEPGSSF